MKTKVTVLLILLLLLFSVAGCGEILLSTRPVSADISASGSVESPAPTVVSTPTQAEEKTTPKPEDTVQSGVIQYTEKGAGYQVEVNVIGLESDAVQRDIEQIIDGQVAQFRQQAIEYYADTPSKEMPSELIITNENTYTNGTFTCLLRLHAFYTGSAHGSTMLVSRTYELSTDRIISLEELFDISDYLQVLGDMSPFYLIEQTFLTEEDIMPYGLEPVPENFETFAIEMDGLRLFFPEYQVASYAAGEQQILIPWGDFHDWLRTPHIWE